MNEILQGALLAFGMLSPFILAAVAWMRSVSSGLADLKLNVASNSARQDATLDDHERRITNLEHPDR
tara:strand:- start:2409 stop:2609 length:201 start_codon:yes stop_codon:yes gene_type:complete